MDDSKPDLKDDDVVVVGLGSLSSGNAVDLQREIWGSIWLWYDVETEAWRSQVGLLVNDVGLVVVDQLLAGIDSLTWNSLFHIEYFSHIHVHQPNMNYWVTKSDFEQGQIKMKRYTQTAATLTHTIDLLKA